MASTLLQIIQAAVRRSGINEIPQSAFLSSSEEVQRLVSLADEAGRALAQDHVWQFLIREATHTTLAAEDQGDITVIAANGFSYILNDTIWNRTLQWPIYGPLDAQDWQAIKGSFPAYPYSEYRIRNNRLLLQPAPAAGNILAFEYVTRFWIQSANQDKFTADTDMPVFDDELMILSIIWRFKTAEGLNGGDAYAKYEERLEYLMSRDGGKRTVSTGNTRYLRGVNYQPGNWTI
ncbi:MAG: hypothetical protein ACRDIC_19655 [bacterium]